MCDIVVKHFEKYRKIIYGYEADVRSAMNLAKADLQSQICPYRDAENEFKQNTCTASVCPVLTSLDLRSHLCAFTRSCSPSHATSIHLPACPNRNEPRYLGNHRSR